MKKTMFLGIAAASLACSQAAETRLPEIAVFVRAQGQSTVPLSPDGTIEFSGVAESKTIEVRNVGYAPLRIDEVRLEGDNPQFTLDLRGTEFPKIIRPAEGAIIERLEFDISFTPGSTLGASRTLVIVSNDPEYPTFRATVSPKSLAPKIVVNTGPGPVDAITPIGQPWPMEFRVTNAGTDALVIMKPLELKDPNDDEFSIFKPLEVEKPIYPKGSGLGDEEATFTIRYVPKDAEPDENFVLIHSNDPLTPVYSIHIRGFVSGHGDIEVSYPDQAVGTGCVDFSKVQEEGQECTKVLTVKLVGGGQVNVRKPKVTPANGPYTVEWYQAGGSYEPDETGCGQYDGTPLPSDVPTALNPQRPSFDVAVTYTAPGAKGVNGTLLFEYTTASGVPGQKEVLLCGGVAKGEFDVAPPFLSSLMFFALPGETKRKTVVVANRGNGPLTILKVEVQKQWPTVDPDAFIVTNPPNPGHEVPAWGLLPMEVEFRTDYEQPKVAATLHITYRDPLTDSAVDAVVQMEGRKDFEGITLPTANPGTPQDYSGAKVGQPLVLDGSKSEGGTYSLPTGNNGFRWFLIEKPPGSRIFLNVADTGPQVTVTPDVAGPYRFGLVVYAGDPTTGYFFSDEATVTVQVQP